MTMQLFGQEEVMRRIAEVARKLNMSGKETLTELGLRIREKGMRITPVDTGNLVGSWYGPQVISEKPLKVEIGLAASYAPYVHEMVGAHFRKPNAQAKFLENPLKEEAGQMLLDLQKGMK